MTNTIKAKQELGLELTEQEKAFYLLFMATDDEAHEILNRREQRQ